ncbi:hypothetical protein MAR_005041 [Mya arenaria]|uniref:Uncharacterized protein n=1 Tax=Mya arenaria TaxID=6604 RepID=A0ABY7F6L2_MYAAR|nr:hypothetical protein MAR_005041 [Mya arenaria]
MTQFSVEKRHQAKGKGCVVVESFQECQQENEFSKANVTSLINSYPVLGSCIIIGKQMETIATKLNTRFGMKKSIGEKYDQEIVVSVSPLRYSVAMETVPGVYIRFMTAYKSVVSVIAEELRTLIGGNPFEGKY